MALLLALLATTSVILIFTGLMLRASEGDAVRSRLSQYAVPARNLEELELRQPFSQRVLAPLARSLSGFLVRFTPPKTIEQLRHNLVLAGNPRQLDVADFLGIKGLVGLLLGSLTFFLTARSGLLLHASGLALVATLLGYFLPNIWLGSRIRARQKEITKALPDALDLLTVSVEAGLGFDAALSKVTQKWQNALAGEFGRVLSEMRMGKSRRDALRAVVTRTEVPDVATFVSAIVQADQLGVSIAKVLHVQSEQMRMRRRQRAEELAHQAPIKMIFPMIFLIFPSIYVITLGPALPSLVKSLTGR
ncbi:MAG: type II secretion system F family protein [Chloroflexi bacterium]|nr:type II secretion system F family protein [Chloroflexota bacterium]